MPLGAGKYNDICTRILKETKAEGVLILVVAGNEGTGSSCQMTSEAMEFLPNALRAMADEMEKDFFQNI